MSLNNGCIFDFDDTLVETTIYYDKAKEKFAQKMDIMGYPMEEALKILNRFDISNVIKGGGFHKHCFPDALVQTYEYYCDNFGHLICDDIRQWMADLGWWVFKQPTELIDGANEVLKTLYSSMPLFLATKGDDEIQMARLEESGLRNYFRKIYIVSDKTHKEYLKIAHDNEIIPENSWIIGNSMKGDINPGIRSGFNCIHVFHHNTWDFEEEEPIGQYYSVKSLKEVPEIVIGIYKNILS
jgi:putative hydrolase of the HAD superfamily